MHPIKFLIMQVYPGSFHFLSLRPRQVSYSPLYSQTPWKCINWSRLREETGHTGQRFPKTFNHGTGAL